MFNKKKLVTIHESKRLNVTTERPFMKKDNQLLVLTHLSQLLDYVSGIGGFIVPLILWLTKKDDIEGMDLHGKAILNFRISIFIYLILCVPLLLLLGLGLIGIIAIAVIAFIFPIVNAIKASNGEAPKYPFSIPFIK